MSEVDFDVALAAKVAALEEGRTAELEVEEEETPVLDPEADEEAEEESESEDEAAEDEAAEEAPTRPDWLPGKFENEQELARAYVELESSHGRLGQRVGELNKIVDQIALTTPQQQQAMPSMNQMQDALDENPEAVAYMALQQGHVPGESALMDQIMDAWFDQAPRAASKFERDIELARLRHEFSEEVSPSIEQVRQESGKRALALAHRELQTKYPDFQEVVESVTEADLAGLDASVLGQLQKNDPKAALEMVYRWVAVGKRASAQTQAAASTEAQKAEVLQRKREAAVATSSTAPVRGEKSAIDLFKEEILKPEPHSVYHGLTQ